MLAWLGDRERAELLWFCGYLLAASLYGLQAVLTIAPESFPFNGGGFAWLQILTGYGSYAMYVSFVIAALGFQLRWLHAVVWLAWIYLQLPFHATRAFGYFTFFTGGISLVLIALAWQQRPQENSLVAKPLRLLALSLAAVE